jgi:formylglycine-generating enzyme required for sulfatase activity
MTRAKIGSLVLVGSALLAVVGGASQSLAAAEGASPDLAPALEPADLLPASGEAPVADPQPPAADRSACPADMVEVEGTYCPSLEQTCVRWADPQKTRCVEFAAEPACTGETVPKHFCIDRFEFPNQEGQRPVVMRSWEEAEAACSAEGKRLCGDTEWTTACEGEERTAYPYGNARDAEACNIDKPHKDADMAAYADPKTRAAEAARLWQGEPSGSRPGCKSSYGVFDMTGNVDEWVRNESGAPHQSGLKGGHWGPVRNRCRPMTTSHDEAFSFYQIGFRCCSDASE